MDVAQQQQEVSIQDALRNMADTADQEKFSAFFRKARKLFPNEITYACLSYLAQKGLDPAGQKMAMWLAAEVRYFKVMLDTALPTEAASKAAFSLAKTDPHFLAKFLKEVEHLTISPQIIRALSIAPKSGNSALLPWLKKLSQHTDERIRSRAVKLMCELRPQKENVERQLGDENSRVRANAIEALWSNKTAEAAEMFRRALTDSNHRVVGNALVGLHLLGDPQAFAKMTELSQSSQVALRRSMAWCLGHIQDPRAIPVLQKLSTDVSPVVRNRALRSLQTLQPAESVAA